MEDDVTEEQVEIKSVETSSESTETPKVVETTENDVPVEDTNDSQEKYE